MSMSDRHAAFKTLHSEGCFVMPNPWDIGSAKVMAALGAKALATTSSGHAFTIGKGDMGHVTRDEALAHAADIVAATDLPVNGDLENGYGSGPEDVVATVRGAAEAGLSGCGIEDLDYADGVVPIEFDLAVERIRAGADAVRGLGRDFVLTARADGVMTGVYDLAEGIRRVQAFAEAGADVIYIPVPPGPTELAQVIAAVDVPVNALAVGPMRDLQVSDLAAMGVRRISVGGMIARLTQETLVNAMRGLMKGDLGALKGGANGSEIDALLREGSAHG